MKKGWASLLGKHPLFLLAVAGAAGVLATEGQSPLIPSFGITAGVFLLLSLIAARVFHLFVATFCFFGFSHGVRWQQTFEHPLLRSPAAQAPEAVRVFGRFVSGPMQTDDKRVEVIFEASRVDFLTRTYSVHGISRLQLSGKAVTQAKVHGGEYELVGMLRVPVKSLNPTLYDRFATAIREGLVGSLSVTSCVPQGPPQFDFRLLFLRGAEASRQWIARQLSLGIEQDEDAAALIRTMALGTAEKDAEHLEEPFRNSGTLHVFAVSGLHVGLIGVIGWLALKSLGFRRSYALWILIPLVFGYAFVTGWRPSAARSAFMMGMMVMSPFMNRRGRIVNALGLAALLLWIQDTHQMFQAGFQLSFLVLLAIAMVSHAMAEPFLPWAKLDDYLPEQLADRWQKLWAWGKKASLMLLATSMAAWLGSTPLMLAHFRNFTPVALLANLVLVPLSFLSLACVALSLMASLVGLTGLQTSFNNANLFLAHAMVKSAEGFSSIPGGNISFEVPEPATNEPPQMLIPALPPGQSGQLLISHGEGWWLDCGNSRSYDRVLLPMVQSSGLKKFGGMVLSHSDTEHVGAGERLFKRFNPPQLVLPLHEPWMLDSRATTLWQLVDSPRLKHTSVRHMGTGQSMALGARVTMQVLYPSAEDLYDKADDRVMVARLVMGDVSVMWCSDAGFLAEKAVLKRFTEPELKSTVLLRGQHTADFTALPEFVSAVAPRLVITPDFPTVPGEAVPQRLRDYCAAHAVPLINLQEDGYTTLKFLPRAVEVTTYASQKNFIVTP